jgi:hypothetical protein
VTKQRPLTSMGVGFWWGRRTLLRCRAAPACATMTSSGSKTPPLSRTYSQSKRVILS